MKSSFRTTQYKRRNFSIPLLDRDFEDFEPYTNAKPKQEFPSGMQFRSGSEGRLH